MDKRLQHEDLTGMEVKTWVVERYNFKGTWECRCKECGATEIFRAYHIKAGRVKQCTHSNGTHTYKIDLSNKEFGELKVKNFNPITGKWVCECSCGEVVEHTTYDLNIRGIKSCGHNTSKFKDRTNQEFGELKLIRYMGNRKWECKCSCGNIIVVNTGDLTSGNTKSCGHIRGNKLIDLTGKYFGEWYVVKYLGNQYWECECSCGATRVVHGYSLRHGVSTKCNRGIHKYIDITDKSFGELTAKKYLGDGIWECDCSCGNNVKILGVNLRNGSTRSCGCKTTEMLIDTLKIKYGETSACKVSKPRQEYQIEIINDSKLLEAFIVRYTTKYNIKPTYKVLGEMLGVNGNTIKRYIDSYELNSIVASSNNISQAEIELRTFIENNTTCEIISNSKSILPNNKELDIYIPEKQLTFEFNGTYWHSDLYKDINYHQTKSLECEKLGIRLIHVFEYEWNDEYKRLKIERLIKHELNNSTNIIQGRETTIVEVDSSESSQFYDQNHLQGSINAAINIGLKTKSGELVEIMSFGKPRFNAEYQYELLRLCSKSGKTIIGGASKVFKYFIEKYKPESVISYCDISKFSGEIYNKLGFKLDHISKPNYVWVDNSTNDIKTRYETQKHKLLEKNLGVPEQTEDEIMKSIGYLKVYDSGNKVFVYNR